MRINNKNNKKISMVSITSLASICLVPSPCLASLRPEEELEAGISLLEAHRQAGRGFGQVG